MGAADEAFPLQDIAGNSSIPFPALLSRLVSCNPHRLSSQTSAAGTKYAFPLCPSRSVILFYFIFSEIVKTFLHCKIRNCHLNSFDKPNHTHPSILNETKGKGNRFFFVCFWNDLSRDCSGYCIIGCLCCKIPLLQASCPEPGSFTESPSDGNQPLSTDHIWLC